MTGVSQTKQLAGKNDSGLLCGRYEDIPREWRRGGGSNKSAQRAIRKRTRIDDPPRKITQLPGDEAGLPRACQGGNYSQTISCGS